VARQVRHARRRLLKELDRLWEQLRPLYLSLHAYVRSRLHDKYGAMVPESGPIPAHLLGNLWQQDWSNIYDIVAPQGEKPVFSLTDNLKAHNIEPLEMVRIGERFFTSLGFAPLPKTFWERSLFLKPRDREVVCHASAFEFPPEFAHASREAWRRPNPGSRATDPGNDSHSCMICP
jgi:peptidyl-dipeptidase A